MKHKKMLLILLILSSLVCLSGCSEFINDLFNEDNLSYSNVFNPPDSTPKVDPNAVIAGGVAAKDTSETPNVYCFKNICYAKNDKIANTYKIGGPNHIEYDINNGLDYEGNKSSNNYDLYVPKDLNKNEKHVVILFIHGGAWISGFKTDVNSYVHEFANRGYITATIKYSLLNKAMDDPSLSIFRNLDEIDACITSIKSALQDLEFDTSKSNLVIGGASSGAHLAMLYSYSRGHKSALPIKFIVDAVGPVNIKPENWKWYNLSADDRETAKTAGIGYEAIENLRSTDGLQELRVADGTEVYYWNEYHTMRIANGMCGIPFSISQIEATTDENKAEIINPNAASNSLTRAGGGEDQLSVTYWINSSTNKLPIICAYGGMDTVVGIAQYAALEKALNDNAIDHEYFYFKDSNHVNITAEDDATAYNGFVNKIDDWCQNI